MDNEYLSNILISAIVWPTTDGWDPSRLVRDVLDMMDKAMTIDQYGPFVLTACLGTSEW